jgi:hypothetical protein
VPLGPLHIFDLPPSLQNSLAYFAWPFKKRLLWEIDYENCCPVMVLNVSFFLIGQLSSYFANSWRIFRLNACFLPRTDVNQCSQGQLQIWMEHPPIQIPLRGRIGKIGFS